MITAKDAIQKFNKEAPVKAVCLWDSGNEYVIAGSGQYDSYYKMDKNTGKFKSWPYQLELEKFRKIMDSEPALFGEKGE